MLVHAGADDAPGMTLSVMRPERGGSSSDMNRKLNGSSRPYVSKRRATAWRAIFGFRGEVRGPLRKLRYYLFVISLITIAASALALLNGYYRFANISYHEIALSGLTSPFLLAGYLGMFLTIAFSPVPDYFMVPAFGYLSSIGVFDPYTTFLVCLLGAIVPITYVPGRFVGRPLLLRSVAYFGISERALGEADKWLVEHGNFSVFIATFIPFFYSVIGLAAGMLRMNAAKFLLASTAGYGLRFVVLEYVGYQSILIFTASFDYAQRALFFTLLIISFLYSALYLVETLRSAREGPEPEAGQGPHGP